MGRKGVNAVNRLIVCCCLVLVDGVAFAQEAPPTKLVLKAARSPSPVLRYPLLPELRSQQPGNAVEHYRKAQELIRNELGSSAGYDRRLERWRAVPLTRFPKAEVRAFFDQAPETFKEIALGARSEGCDWGVAEELRKNGIFTELAGQQELREFINLLDVRARLELAEGSWPQALHTVQTGLTMGRHVAESPTLISALIGVAVSQIMLNRLQEVMQQPDVPNLYWALTDLPQPFIDLHRGLQGERLSTLGTFPGLAELVADPNAGPLPPDKIRVIVDRAVAEQGGLEGIALRVQMALRLNAQHEQAKAALVEQGRPRDKVEQLPHVQVGLLYALLDYDKRLDDMGRVLNLPYWEARPLLDAQKLTRRSSPNVTAMPLSKNFLPAVEKIFEARVRVERRIALLRCIEAVRLYAANHGGEVPQSLADVTEVPVPPDPLTGKPFGYEGSGVRATLTAAPYPGDRAIPNTNTLTYELTIRR
jgi:hypothetical protein